MPQLTTPTRKNPSDRQSRSFGTPSKIDLTRLDLENVGADSPELLLNRARYQAVRENEMARQAEITSPSNTNRDTATQSQKNQNSPINQVAEASTDAPDTQLDNTSEQMDLPQLGDATTGDKKDRKEKPSDKKDSNNKEERQKKEAKNKPDSQGGGAEKKDPGVTPGSLPKSGQPPKQAQKQEDSSASKSDKLNQAKAQVAANLKNTKDKLKSGDIGGAVEGVTAAGKIASSWALTVMWGAVWLDWTLLTLLGLNVYFVASNFTDKIAAFGEDYLFGKWMPKELAKWFEIILLALLDMIVLSIVFMILYGGYKFYTASFSDIIVGGAKGIWSGEGAATGAAKEILKP
jgi:hypothetical protein